MFTPFSHFLSYGSTDQQTIREFAGQYDGIIVPGTIAAFQAEGTRGFVLSLSAAEQTPYAIDSRFPLFQSYLEKPKKSHLALARILGLEKEIVDNGTLRPSYWDAVTVRDVAERWYNFNTAYLSLQPKAFDKYARRLKRPLPQVNAQGPEWILPPYLTVCESYPGSRQVSDSLWEASVAIASAQGQADRLRRVAAVERVSELSSYAIETETEEIVVWVSNLDEQNLASGPILTQYAREIAAISAAGRSPFALYGGYFSVVLRAVGLTGSSHGVGFSEHRNHVELQSSGAAPARYYVQRAHKYFPIDLASELWRRNPTLVESYYNGFRNVDPQELEYHDLMMHSVRARRDEIVRSAGMSLVDHVEDLRAVGAQYELDLAGIRLTEGLQRRVQANLAHLAVWRDSIGRV